VKSWFNRARPLAIAAALAIAFGACDEKLNGGTSCPLCPGQPGTLQEDTLLAVVFDTSIAGFPTLGGEFAFFVATLGDTIESAAALRFDSLPTIWRRTNQADDSTIAYVDTGSHVKLQIITGDTLGLETTVEIYDIDMLGVEDTMPQAVATAFTPDRLLGSRTVPADSLRDSVKVPIDPAFILARITDTVPMNRIRLGVRVTQAGNPRLTVVSSNSAGSAELVFRPSADTAVAVPTLRVETFSRVPGDPTLRAHMADYQVVIKAPPDPPPNVFRVGGLPARRAYLRFDIPSAIIDSSSVVRATLLLTQRPNPISPEAGDSVGLGHFGVVSGGTLTDLTRTLFFIERLQNRDTLFVFATDSAVRNFEMIDWVRAWRGTDPFKTPRAIALASASENFNARQVDFFSIEAAAELRPRLRITYIPRPAGPLP
jgi:hypothetical protein